MTQYAELSDLYEVINKAADRIGCDDLITAKAQGKFTDDEIKTITKYARDVVNLGQRKLLDDEPFAGIFAQRVHFHVTYELRACFASNFTGHGLEVKMNIFYNPFAMCYNQGVRSLGTFMPRVDKQGKLRKLKSSEPSDYYNTSALILHECLHLIHDHQHEFEFYDKQGLNDLTNIAEDGSINQVSYIENNPVLNKGGISYQSLQKMVGSKIKLKPKDTAMNYFEALYKANKQQIKQMRNFLQGLKDGQAAAQQKQGNNQNQSSSQQNNNQSQSGQGQSGNQTNGNQPQNGQNQSGQGQSGNQTNGSQPQNGQNQNAQGQSGNQMNGSQPQNGQNQNGQSQSGNQTNGNQPQNGQNQNNQNAPTGVDKNSDAYKAGYELGKSSANPNNSHDTNDNSPKDVEETRNDTPISSDAVNGQLLSAIQDSMKKANMDPQTLKQRGLISGNMADQLLEGKATNKHTIPIKSILLRGSGRLKYSQKKTYTRPNHRQSNRPDLLKGKRKLNNKNLHVFVDCSGSMSTDDINWAVAEIAHVAKQIKAKLTLIPFDTEVYTDKKQTISKNGKYSFEPKGRGGTAVQPCFDYLKEIHATSNSTDMAIILTDGYVEDHIDTYGLRNIVWILVNSNEDTLSVEDKIGLVGYLENDQGYVFHKMSQR